MNESSETETEQQRINRREAIRRVSALLGGVAFAGGSDLLAAVERAGAAAARAPGRFSAQDVAFLDEIAETILPETKTPGAKAAKTGAFMALMVTDSYSPAEQKVFLDGMRKVDEASRKANDAAFMAATPAQRLAVLTALDHEQKRAMDARETGTREPAHYFRMMKELALLGYFTSKIGCTQAMRYVEAPGRFDPCLPYTPGEPAWASHA
jgi:predicted ATPase